MRVASVASTVSWASPAKHRRADAALRHSRRASLSCSTPVSVVLIVVMLNAS